MGSKISGICGSEDRGRGEVTLSNGNSAETPMEVVKAKSAVRIQSNWKSRKIHKITQGLIMKKHLLDEKSSTNCEFLTADQMQAKISQNVVEFEKRLPAFVKEPELSQFKYCFFREPVRLHDGSVYLGQWNEQGEKHGYGVLVQQDGSKYEGFFLSDKICGRGRYIDKEGKFYYEGKLQLFNCIGNWSDNKANDKGSYVLSDGTRYSGDWKEDQQEGLGEEVSPDGTVYVGEFKDGEKHGKGKITWPDGSCYEGEFQNSMIHGKGIYRWADGRVYDGHWLNGKMNGKGKFTWPDGKCYEGEYKNDKKDGFGRYTQDGKVYEGTWFNGKQNGYGTYYANNEILFKAFWRYGKIIKREIVKNENMDNFSVGTNGNIEAKTFNTNERNAENIDKNPEKNQESPANPPQTVSDKKPDENKENEDKNLKNAEFANGNH